MYFVIFWIFMTGAKVSREYWPRAHICLQDVDLRGSSTIHSTQAVWMLALAGDQGGGLGNAL